MNEGWKCPSCGKAHGPHVDTCPEESAAPYPCFPIAYPRVFYDPYDPLNPPFPNGWPYPVTTC